MGARAHMSPRLQQILPEHLEFGYVGRPERAASGEGYPAAHSREQNRIVTTALGPRAARSPSTRSPPRATADRRLWLVATRRRVRLRQDAPPGYATTRRPAAPRGGARLGHRCDPERVAVVVDGDALGRARAGDGTELGSARNDNGLPRRL